jgi:hypothetical protein
VRPADRAAGGLLEHRRELDANTELVQRCTIRSARSVACRAVRATSLPARACPERCSPRMCVSTSPSTALNSTPGRRAHRAQRRRSSRRRFRDGVMIGQRDGGQPRALRGGNHVRRRTRSVGGSGVDVKIDESARRRARGLDRRHAE